MWIWSQGLLHRSLTVCSPSELQTNCGIRAIYNLLAMDLFSCFQKSFLLSTPISWTWFGWEWDHSGGDSSTSQSILSLLSPHPLKRGCQRGILWSDQFRSPLAVQHLRTPLIFSYKWWANTRINRITMACCFLLWEQLKLMEGLLLSHTYASVLANAAWEGMIPPLLFSLPQIDPRQGTTP